VLKAEKKGIAFPFLLRAKRGRRIEPSHYLTQGKIFRTLEGRFCFAIFEKRRPGGEFSKEQNFTREFISLFLIFLYLDFLSKSSNLSLLAMTLFSKLLIILVIRTYLLRHP
jgi:hypothetical protein